MITYKDRTFCCSDVVEHNCGREITNEDKKYAEELGLPIAYGDFCDNKHEEKRP